MTGALLVHSSYISLEITRLSMSNSKRRATRTRRWRSIVYDKFLWRYTTHSLCLDVCYHLKRRWCPPWSSKLPIYETAECNPCKSDEDHGSGSDFLRGCHALCNEAGIHIDHGCAGTVFRIMRREREALCYKIERVNVCRQLAEGRDNRSSSE